MGRLLRPTIPVHVKCLVALGQLGEMWPHQVVGDSYGRLGALLKESLSRLAVLLGCTVADLRLDHDPPLGARQKVFDRHGSHVGYVPDANDPEHLRYRPHGPEFEGSHLIKTNVAGAHGQHPDRVLIAKNRRMEEREGTRPPRKTRPKAKMRSVSRWPKGRKINWRKP